MFINVYPNLVYFFQCTCSGKPHFRGRGGTDQLVALCPGTMWIIVLVCILCSSFVAFRFVWWVIKTLKDASVRDKSSFSLFPGLELRKTGRGSGSAVKWLSSLGRAHCLPSAELSFLYVFDCDWLYSSLLFSLLKIKPKNELDFIFRFLLFFSGNQTIWNSHKAGFLLRTFN